MIQKHKTRYQKAVVLGIIVLSMILLHCAALQEFVNIQKPTAKINTLRLTGMSLEELDLAFDVDIFNPNALSASLASFDYDFKGNLNLNTSVPLLKNINLPIERS